jgi:hypothetical protein
MEAVQQLLKDVNEWHPNIKLQGNIGKSVPFLDVLVKNDQGVLHTSVYHKPSAEPYVVPFLSDHPRHTFPNIIQMALVRAIRYSSTFATFNSEQIAVELILLYNESVFSHNIEFLHSECLYFSYPSTYIDKQFRNILGDGISSTSILPVIDNEHKFNQLRRK